MLKVNSTEVQNNFGKYLLLAQEREIIVTRNGQDMARLTGLNFGKNRSNLVAEQPIASGYGLKKATYEEFLEMSANSEQRYEYIDGEVFLQTSPKTNHQFATSALQGLFYQFFTDKPCHPFVAPCDITISRFEGDINVVQPDLMIICDLDEQLGDDGYYKGVPDLVVEVLSASTKRNDLVKKLNLYLDGGIKEYWVVNPEEKQVLVYFFKNGDIARQVAFKDHEHAVSFLFPELTIDLTLIFRAI